MEDKKKRIIFIVSIIVIIIITIIASYFIYKNFYMEDENIYPDDNIQNGDSLENNEKKKELTFKMKSERQLCSDHDTDEDCITYTIETETTTPKYLSSMGTYDDITFVLYKDNGLKIYDFKNKETRKLNIPEDDYYLVYDSYNQTEYFGIMNKNKYYDLKDGKETLITDNIINTENSYGGIIYDNNGLKVYNFKTQKITNLNLNKEYKDMILFYNDDKIYGVYYKDNYGTSSYYNVITGKTLYNGTKDKIYGISEDYAIVYEEEVFDLCLSFKYIISTNEEKIIATPTKEDIESCNTFSAYKTENGTFFIKHIKNFYPDVNIYTENFELIDENIPLENYKTFNNYIYVIKDNIIKIYDAKGKIVDTITSYSKPLGFIEDYLVFVENDYLKTINLNEPNTKIEITKWQDNYIYKGKFAFIKNKKICFPIEYKDKVSDYKDTGIEFYYDLTTKEVTTKNIDYGFSNQYWD